MRVDLYFSRRSLSKAEKSQYDSYVDISLSIFDAYL